MLNNVILSYQSYHIKSKHRHTSSNVYENFQLPLFNEMNTYRKKGIIKFQITEILQYAESTNRQIIRIMANVDGKKIEEDFFHSDSQCVSGVCYICTHMHQTNPKPNNSYI